VLLFPIKFEALKVKFCKDINYGIGSSGMVGCMVIELELMEKVIKGVPVGGPAKIPENGDYRGLLVLDSLVFNAAPQ